LCGFHCYYRIGGFKVKRTILFILLASCAIALIPAQGNNRRGPAFPPDGQRSPLWGRGEHRNYPPQETVTISGNLNISRGMIAISSGGVTYLTSGLYRFVGFIDGLKEGAAVTLEGYAVPVRRDNNVKLLQVQKMSLNGKEYDLARPRQMRMGRWNTPGTIDLL
jgi:hypothetical protein